MSRLHKALRFTGRRIRGFLIPAMVVVFAGSLALRLWTSGVYYRKLPGPALAAHCVCVLLQTCAWEDGVHFLVMRTYGDRLPILQPGRATNLGRAGYHHGTVLSALGFVLAVLLRPFHGSDYHVAPHLAFVLPYWFLILLSGWLLLRLSGITGVIGPYCRFSKLSICVGGLVLVAFAALNVVPSASRPGSRIQPKSLKGWTMLTFAPGNSHTEILLQYGFPSVCYRRGIINGRSVDIFYGRDDLGCEQHTLIENVGLALLAMMVAMMATEWLRRRMPASGPSSPDTAQQTHAAD